VVGGGEGSISAVMGYRMRIRDEMRWDEMRGMRKMRGMREMRGMRGMRGMRRQNLTVDEG